MKNTMQRYNKYPNYKVFCIENMLFLIFIKPFAIPFKLSLQ